jgi:F0F1-type ATP synthase membrane subunit b/b'
MDDTPTPRTDEFLGTLERHEGRIAWSIKDIEALVERARQLERELNESQSWVRASMESAATSSATIARLERELNEARQQQESKVTPALIMDYARVQAERDQLRRVCDELANTIYVHSLRPQNALDGYDHLPHVQERKTR